MKNYLTILSLCFLFTSLHSCTPSAPYEITSPCVSINSDNPYVINPCAKRPVNLKHLIS